MHKNIIDNYLKENYTELNRILKYYYLAITNYQYNLTYEDIFHSSIIYLYDHEEFSSKLITKNELLPFLKYFIKNGIFNLNKREKRNVFIGEISVLENDEYDKVKDFAETEILKIFEKYSEYDKTIILSPKSKDKMPKTRILLYELIEKDLIKTDRLLDLEYGVNEKARYLKHIGWDIDYIKYELDLNDRQVKTIFGRVTKDNKVLTNSDQYDKDIILELWNKYKHYKPVCEELKIPASTLYHYMDKYGIQRNKRPRKIK